MDQRVDELTSGGDSIVVYEAWASDPAGTSTQDDSELLKEIWKYNRVDCISMIDLVDWLRAIQDETSHPYHILENIDREVEMSTLQQELAEMLNNKA